jgi:RHS repeat-associated protein
VAAVSPDPAQTTEYAYTPAGALASVTTPAVTVGYTVDGRGLRQSRTDDLVWSTAGALPVLLEGGGHAYLYGPSLAPIAQVDGTGGVEYLHGDLLGSVRAITDDTGEVAGRSTFDAFGVRTAHTGAGDSAFGFTGSWTDPDTGLVHLRARDYDPGTGQFLSVDPAVDATRQPYAYTGNNPLLRTDPSGLCPIRDGTQVPDCTPADYGAIEFWLTPAGDLVADATFDSFLAHIYWGIGDGATMGGTSDVMYALNGACMESEHDGFYWAGVVGGVGGISLLSLGTADAYGANKLAQQEATAAENAAAKAATRGETAWTKLGREMHAAWNYGPGFTKEFRLDNGQRADAVNLVTREVVELKPNSQRAISAGYRQLAGYIRQLNEEYPGGTPWTGRVETYDR